MKRTIIILMAAVAGISAVIVSLVLSGPATETNISQGGIFPDMNDTNRQIEVATFALG